MLLTTFQVFLKRINLKSNKDKFIFWLLLLTGLSGMLTTIFTDSYRLKLNALVPLPKVFVDEHYLYEKEVRVYHSPESYLSYNLKNEKGWPFKKGLLIEFYSLLNSLDRPQLVDKKYWNETIDFYFCKKSPYLKDVITSRKIYKVQVYIRLRQQSWKLAKEYTCSH